jgi:hypothetical protein
LALGTFLARVLFTSLFCGSAAIAPAVSVWTGTPILTREGSLMKWVVTCRVLAVVAVAGLMMNVPVPGQAVQRYMVSLTNMTRGQTFTTNDAFFGVTGVPRPVGNEPSTSTRRLTTPAPNATTNDARPFPDRILRNAVGLAEERAWAVAKAP